MGLLLGPLHCLLFLLVFCHGRGAEQQGSQEAPRDDALRRLLAAGSTTTRLEPAGDMPELDVSTPLATVPLVNPTTPTPLASATPSLANPATAVGGGGGGGGGGSGSGSWCVASPSAGATALQVALDYACGPQGGVDCSAIQPGGSCANPDTVRDHASYAFNSYYQRNPVQTSCDFAGTAILTSTDPSTSTCKYPATSTGASVLNTTTPTTPTFAPNFETPPTYGNSPPGYGNAPPLYGTMSPPDYGGSISAAATAMPALSLTCLLLAAAAVSLNV